jgi:serine/threonine protein kinase
MLEYADETCLGNPVDRGIRVADRSILSIMTLIMFAFQYLQGIGRVHQGSKPSNMLIDGDGRAFLADFHINRPFDSEKYVVGSPTFEAPKALDDRYGLDNHKSSSHDDPQKEDIWPLA